MRGIHSFGGNFTRVRRGSATKSSQIQRGTGSAEETAAMKHARSSNRPHGFTLMELLLVMAIIGVLAAMLLPVLQKARPRAERVRCLNNLRQTGIAFHSFAHDHDEQFPMQVPAHAGGSREFSDPTNSLRGDFAFRHFQPLARELGSPAILICPSDTRRAALTFPLLQNSNVSYLVGPRARYGHAVAILAGDRNVTNDWLGPTSTYRLDANNMVRWTRELHRFQGNLLFADGHAEQWNNTALIVATGRGLAPGTLILPTVTIKGPVVLPPVHTWAPASSSAPPALVAIMQSPRPRLVPASPAVPAPVSGQPSGRKSAGDNSGASTTAGDQSSWAQSDAAANRQLQAASAAPPASATAPSPPPAPVAPNNPVQFIVAMVHDIVTGFYGLLLFLLALLVAWRIWYWLRHRPERASRLGRRNEPEV